MLETIGGNVEHFAWAYVGRPLYALRQSIVPEALDLNTSAAKQMSIDRPRARTRQAEAKTNGGEQQMQPDCSRIRRQHPELEHADQDRHNGSP